jgi:hypothetical protein
MRYPKIKKRKLFDSQFSSSDPQKEYYLQIISFLEDVFPDGLNISQAFVLMTILQLYQIALRDGFVINDERDDEKVIGAREAGVIASHLCTDYSQTSKPPLDDYQWWSTMYYSKRDVTEAEREEIKEKLLGRLMLHPEVEWIHA